MNLGEIRARADRATPGPWQWFGNTDVQQVYLATKRWGRMFVMGFHRWGMQGAKPVFFEGRSWRPDPESIGDFTSPGRMVDANERARYEVCPTATERSDYRVYRADLAGIRNADAEFIAHSRQDVAELLGEVDRLTAQRDRAQELLTAVIDQNDVDHTCDLWPEQTCLLCVIYGPHDDGLYNPLDLEHCGLCQQAIETCDCLTVRGEKRRVETVPTGGVL